MQVFLSKLKNQIGLVPQPDALTCQSAAIAMALGTRDVAGIRASLLSRGTAGDPAVMGNYLRSKIGDRYLFDMDASLLEAREYLKQGCFLITHGYFTAFGHVIAIDGVEIDPSNMSYRLRVRDPWSQFNFQNWGYDLGDVGYSGFYSSYGIYAACVASTSIDHAKSLYRNGVLDSAQKGMWLHCIKP